MKVADIYKLGDSSLHFTVNAGLVKSYFSFRMSLAVFFGGLFCLPPKIKASVKIDFWCSELHLS
jgi:hypothetical protein